MVLWLHQLLLPDALSADFVSRYLAPITEETAKGLLVAALVVSGRVGFLVDAGVQGFAVGAGFALVENVLYLQALPDAPVALWLVRGLGTAMLHGATTAIVAMAGRARYDRRNRQVLAAFLPGFALAVGLHSASNHLLLHPVAQTLIILMILPAVVTWIFDRSERATREWVSAGLDLDLEVLQLVVSEHFSVTRFGEYLRELRERFPGRSSPTCIACCVSSSSSPCRPRRSSWREGRVCTCPPTMTSRPRSPNVSTCSIRSDAQDSSPCARCRSRPTAISGIAICSSRRVRVQHNDLVSSSGAS